MSLASAVLTGDRLALSRLLSQIEDDTQEGRTALAELFPKTGKAHLIGVTGAPGTGKSTLVNRLAHHYRHPVEGMPARRVAIVAVDPSSPFSGGAILGDRIRMRDLAGDPGVFIRSMASRGALGGLASTTAGLVMAFDASGFEVVLIETVGAGQVEVDIARLAHTTLVVDAPGLGDDVQAIKAGILEIADVLVVNKADRPGAEQTARALRAAIQLGHPVSRRGHGRGQPPVSQPSSEAQDPETYHWTPPVLLTVATQGDGIFEVAEAIERHVDHLHATREWVRRERARLQADLDNLLQHSLIDRWRRALPDQEYEAVLDDVVARRMSPRQAVTALLDGSQRP